MRQFQVLSAKLIVFCLSIGFGFHSAHAETEKNKQSISISSPDQRTKLNLHLLNGQLFYSVDFQNQKIIKPSKLGFVLRGNTEAKALDRFDNQFTIVNKLRTIHDSSWEQVWGQNRIIRDQYTRLRVYLKQAKTDRKLNLIFRLYNDGIGFRYEFPEQDNLKSFSILDELTEFQFTEDNKTWWIPAFSENRYEYLYSVNTLDELSKKKDLKAVHTPVTFRQKNGVTISIHEANLTDYSSMALAIRADKTLEAELFPWSDGDKVKLKTPAVSPWRTIQIGEKSSDLLGSNLILNLNEPNKLKDTSWVKPAKYVGIWWGMHIGAFTWGSGPFHGATTSRTKMYIDFAAENGFDGVLVEGWNKGWDGNWIANGNIFRFMETHRDFDIKEVTDYAKSKGVKLIGHHETSAGIMNYEAQLPDAFAYYKRYGVDTIKTGYVGHGKEIKRIDANGKEQLEWHHGQHMVRHYRMVTELAAKFKIMLNVHEPIKDTGIRRTYPNLMTREGARGQEFNAWSEGNPPSHTAILPFTRMLSGPFDFTPGIFRLIWDTRKTHRVHTTLAKQLALYVVLYSPINMAADMIHNYKGNKAFQFIKDVPVDWEKTVPLNGEIGEFVSIARKDRNSDDWYLGSLTNEKPRSITFPLTFLDEDKEYVAELYLDGTKASYKEAPYEINIGSKKVTRDSTLKIFLASGGGAAIRFRAKLNH